MKKRRRLRKDVVYVLFVISAIVVVLVAIFLYNFNFHFINKHSIHEDALAYKTRNSLVFYPDCKTGKEKAMEISKGAEKNAIIDYALVPHGDYYLVKYSDGTSYYVDRNYNDLQIGEINEEGKRIISDYLRYSMKKDEIDEAYTYDFVIKTYYKNLSLDNTQMSIEDSNLLIHFDLYDYDLRVPLKYMQKACGINLGYENETYAKPRFISNKRPMVCFTFDDGPDMSLKTSGQMVDKLYELDSSGTFFILGNRLGEKQINFCKESVEKGMEYGSHTQSHPNLVNLSSSEINAEVMTPYHDLCDNEYGFGYVMKVFRPPYGSRNSIVDQAVDLTAILWNVDSLDWSYRTQYEHDECVEVICNKVIDETNENDIILFHDIYQTSVDAACKLAEHFLKNGYQIVNVSELLKALDKTNVKVFSGQ